MTSEKKEKNREVTAVRRKNDVKFTITPIDAVLQTPGISVN